MAGSSKASSNVTDASRRCDLYKQWRQETTAFRGQWRQIEPNASRQYPMADREYGSNRAQYNDFIARDRRALAQRVLDGQLVYPRTEQPTDRRGRKTKTQRSPAR